MERDELPSDRKREGPQPEVTELMPVEAVRPAPPPLSPLAGRPAATQAHPLRDELGEFDAPMASSHPLQRSAISAGLRAGFL